MSNLEVFTQALHSWIKPILTNDILPVVTLPDNKWTGAIGSLFGVNFGSYNIMNEFSFLLDPVINNFIQPKIAGLLKNIKDEDLPRVVNEFVDSFINEAKSKGGVNVLGYNFGEVAFTNFREEFNGLLSKQSNPKKSKKDENVKAQN
jgi:hypothetical protein